MTSPPDLQSTQHTTSVKINNDHEDKDPLNKLQTLSVQGSHAMLQDHDKEMKQKNEEQAKNTLGIDINKLDLVKKSATTMGIALRMDPKYRIDSSKYKLFRGYVRQDWGQIEGEIEEVRAEWIELFFDLIFVAIIVHMSGEAVHAYEVGSQNFLIAVFPQFLLVIQVWIQTTMYESRFVMNQNIDDLLRFLVMTILLMLGLSIGDSENQHKLFIFWFALCELMNLMTMLKARLIPRARKHANFMIIGYILTVIICAVCILLVDKSCIWTWNKPKSPSGKHRRLAGTSTTSKNYCEVANHRRLASTSTSTLDIKFQDRMNVTYFIVYCVIFLFNNFYFVLLQWFDFAVAKGISIPINVPHIAERLGLLCIIILGETIISLMTADLKPEPIYFFAVASVFFIVYGIGRLYFLCQPTEEQIKHQEKGHALRIGKLEARVFIYTHYWFFSTLLAIGIGTKLTIHYYDQNLYKYVFVMLPGLGVTFSVCGIYLIRFVHPLPFAPWYIYCIRTVIILIMGGSTWLAKIVNNGLLLSVYVVGIGLLIATDYEGKVVVKEKKQEMKEAAEKAHRGTVENEAQAHNEEAHSEKNQSALMHVRKQHKRQKSSIKCGYF